MKRYRLSIVVPVFKTPLHLLRQMHASVCTFPNDVQIIYIVDSPDDVCVKEVDDLAKGDARITILRNPRNMGVSYSRNKGIEYATGDFITFVDADDRINAQVYLEAVEISLKKKADICVLGRVYESAGIERSRFSNKVYVWDDLFPYISRIGMASVSILFSCNVFSGNQRFRYNEEVTNYEDFLLVTQIMQQECACIYYDKLAYIIAGHPNSLSKQVCPSRYLSSCKAIYGVLSAINKKRCSIQALAWYRDQTIVSLFSDMQIFEVLNKAGQMEYSRYVARSSKIFLKKFDEVLSFPMKICLMAVHKYPNLFFSRIPILVIFVKILIKFRVQGVRY